MDTLLASRSYIRLGWNDCYLSLLCMRNSDEFFYNISYINKCPEPYSEDILSALPSNTTLGRNTFAYFIEASMVGKGFFNIGYH
jgi:hypothetical protein